MGRIRTLTETIINQIAAGEVVENPASVIKELIENSLDAGAKKIWVEIQGGGFGQIVVRDDGSGMSRDDALLSFERHATSKIAQLEDLDCLVSMGFRGEALPSIAAVAKVELVSAEEGKEATKIEIQGGKIISCIPASRLRGTTVSVRSLFYNTPARKKFQKQPNASLALIHKLLFSLALSYPEVGFELISAQETLLSLFPETDFSFLTSFEKRIKALFKTSFLQSKKPISLEKNGYQINGFLALPVDDRINRSGQYLFVNRRAITSPLISAAVKEGYGHRLDSRRYPIFALHLTAPADLIDVNVHPQKREVRFQDEAWLKNFIQSSVRSVFHSFSPLPQTVSAPPQFPEAPLRLRETQEAAPPSFLEDPEVIGLYGPYLFIAEEEAVVLVHLRKIQEKILQKELSSAPKSQSLLIPIPLSLSRQQITDLEEKQPLFHKLGFSIEQSGKENFLVHALPACLKEDDVQDAVELILKGEERLNLFVKFVVRGKKQFLLKEALALWHRAKHDSDPELITRLRPDEIEKLFR